MLSIFEVFLSIFRDFPVNLKTRFSIKKLSVVSKADIKIVFGFQTSLSFYKRSVRVVRRCTFISGMHIHG